MTHKACIRSATARDMPDIVRLAWAYRDVLKLRNPEYPDIAEDYYAQGEYAKLIDDLPRIHARPTGDILVAELRGSVIGCGMYYALDLPKTCEIKRVYVDDTARGTGAGRALMVDAMARAKADGYTRMVLDTMVGLNEAIALYRTLGFTPTAPYYTLKPKYKDAMVFFGIDL